MQIGWRFLIVSKIVTLQDNLEMPLLEPLCEGLLRDILDGGLKGFNKEYYIQQINLHGGVATVNAELVTHIDPHILLLQQKQVTRKLLDEVRRRQGSSWQTRSGYSDCVTDYRNYDYF
ncbi:hypothetical protein N7493_010059 [Penicillium malachiteum]|uniref:Uncharacterized protein n=1 Tax=Penicillium malachiteum TaxID=1324776 RepID=A0AAD6HEB9_9EURO|nr:hypothetical protein N7493_010059 [Penicillium malachiteum]